MEELKVIALTHKEVGLELLGKLHLSDEEQKEKLPLIKDNLGFREMVFISTCNRIEFVLNHNVYLCEGQLKELFKSIQPKLNETELEELSSKAVNLKGENAFRHLSEVASSLHSMIIGEREIITQMRKAFETSREIKISGDLLRLVFRKVIEGAKRVFTETHISRKPVSVVSLAWQGFKAKRLHKDSKIILVGAGQTTGNFARFLKKEGYHNVSVYNRTLSNGQKLADMFGTTALPLSELSKHKDSFSALITCTGASEAIITPELYGTILNGDESGKILIDLALPHDVDPEICSLFDVDYTGMPQLKSIADENIAAREKELGAVELIIDEICTEFDEMYRQRQIELAMQSIPEKIREIKDTALGVVFAKDLEKLDDDSREVLDKVLQYLEKKYISVPMKMAKEVMLDQRNKN